VSSTAVPTAQLATADGTIAVPLLGLGTWQARGDEVYAAVRAALDLGYRHIDTATMYGNEAEIGRAVADSGVERGELFVTTKCPPDRVGREDETLERSLRDLRLDHVDLWLVHWPPHGERGSVRMWERFLAARDAGRATAVGVSNYSPDLIDELVSATGVAPAIDQIPWSPADHDPKLVEELRERGVLLEGYSPFKRTKLDNPTLTSVAKTHGASAAQVVLAWHLKHGFVVIPKSVRIERLASNLAAAELDLSDDEVAAIDALGS
jgi:2,5-diketo-D-gluconate reductase A